MKTPVRWIAVLGAALSAAIAAEPRIWSLGDYSDFQKAKLKGLSLSSDGRVTLAPASKEVLDSASVYLWTLAEDSKGNVYAGGGGPGGPGARVYLIPPEGQGKTVAQFEDLEVHAIAIDAKDQVYAATSPDGKVYRLLKDGKSEVFYDPKAKYIWALAFNAKGQLFVATGDRGEIHRVEPSGKGEVFYKSSETHARSMAIDPQGNLIVGTEPGGLVLRIGEKGQGFVVYQTARREVTAVAVGKDGDIYAAAVGTRTAGATPTLSVPPPSIPTAPAPSPAAQQGAGAPRQVTPAPVSASPVALPSVPGGSELYRIDREGYAQRLWSSAQDIAYSIGFDAQQRPVIGTGNKGLIYRIDSALVSTELLNVSPTQVTAVLGGRSGRVLAATGNIGKVYQVGPGTEAEGTVESEVLDAGGFSRWGRLTYTGQPNGGKITLATRSGNLDRPQTDWSPWSAEVASADGAIAASPAARFLQWRATLAKSGDGKSPVLSAVDLLYAPRNAAPVVREIEITPANYRFPASGGLTLSQPQTLSLPPLGAPASRRSAPLAPDSSSASLQYAKGFTGARWAASDENGDGLTYTVYLRGEAETEWKLLREKLTDRQVSWDSTAFPDGEYRVKVVASDAPDNPRDQAQEAELVSDPFLIDNTPPELTGLAATAAGNKITVKWSARDQHSIIEKAEYSVNGSDWTRVDPSDAISDSRQEEYTLTFDRPAAGELTIAVRVGDEFENRVVGKTVLK